MEIYNGILRDGDTIKSGLGQTLQPLTLNIQRPPSITDSEILGLRNLIKHLLPLLLPHTVDSVSLQQSSDPDLLEFTPYIRISSRYSEPHYWTETNDISGTSIYDSQLPPYDDDSLTYPIYVSDAVNSRINATLNLPSLVGFDILSTDPLVWLAIQEISKKSLLPTGLTALGTTALISAKHELETDIIADITDRVGIYHDDGVISVSSSTLDNQGDLISSLADMYRLPIKGKALNFTFLSAKMDWVEQACQDIRGEMLPLVPITGEFSYLLGPTAETMAKLQYLAVTVYCRLVQDNSILLYGLNSILVMPDLSLSLPLPTQELVKEFTQLFTDSLAAWNRLVAYREISLEHSFSRRLMADGPALTVRVGQTWYTVAENKLPDVTAFDLQRSFQFIQGICIQEASSFNDFVTNFGGLESPCHVQADQLPRQVVNELAIRGVLSFGDVKGLLTGVQEKIHITLGEILIFNDEQTITYTSQGEGWSVDILTIDRRYHSEKLVIALRARYEAGWFFSPWGKACYIYRQKISNVSFRHIPAIAAADEDPDLALATILG